MAATLHFIAQSGDDVSQRQLRREDAKMKHETKTIHAPPPLFTYALFLVFSLFHTQLPKDVFVLPTRLF